MSKRKKIFSNKDNETDTDTGSTGSGGYNPFQRRKGVAIDKDAETDTGSSGSGGFNPFKRRKGTPGDTTSILIAETKSMERNRRLIEQQGERRLASVKARDHSNEEQVQQNPEGELQNTILQHPELDSQRFDGIDPNLNPEPPLNTDARREFDNERREQEMEKQLRLGNMPKFRTDPTPHGP